MFKFFKRIILRFFGTVFYNKLKKLKKNFYKIINFKKLYYDKNLDLRYNEKILSSIFENFNIENVKKILKNNNIDYYDQKISWHFHLFSCFNNEIENILEIGTLDGNFTKFLSKKFPHSKIFSIDLNHENPIFQSTYDRNDKLKLKEFLQRRSENLKNSNIYFSECDSFFVLDKFRDIKFDLIWIDGDHLNPQVSFDIFSSYNLLNENGYLCCDDIIFDDYRTEYVNSDSYITLNSLEQKKILKNNYILKRVSKDNYKVKKYIGVSQKLKIFNNETRL